MALILTGNTIKKRRKQTQKQNKRKQKTKATLTMFFFLLSIGKYFISSLQSDNSIFAELLSLNIIDKELFIFVLVYVQGKFFRIKRMQ